MTTPVVLIPGDGIGPEVTAAMQAVLAAAAARVTWIEAHAGLPAVERFGDPFQRPLEPHCHVIQFDELLARSHLEQASRLVADRPPVTRWRGD